MEAELGLLPATWAPWAGRKHHLPAFGCLEPFSAQTVLFCILCTLPTPSSPNIFLFCLVLLAETTQGRSRYPGPPGSLAVLVRFWLLTPAPCPHVTHFPFLTLAGFLIEEKGKSCLSGLEVDTHGLRAGPQVPAVVVCSELPLLTELFNLILHLSAYYLLGPAAVNLKN